MNSGMFLQMMGNGLISGTAQKTSSNQSTKFFGNSGESFKDEMYKAFENVGNNSSSKNEKSGKSDVNKAVTDTKSNKNESSQKDVNELDDSVKSNEKPVEPDEEKAAAAVTQTQQPVQIISEAADEAIVMTMEKSEACADNNSETQKLTDNFEIEKATEEPLIENDGRFAAQSNADLVKSNMLRNSTVKFTSKETDTENDVLKDVKLEAAEVSETETDEAIKNLNFVSEDESDLQEKSSEEESEAFEGEYASLKTNNTDTSKYFVKVADAPVDTSRADAAQQMADKIVHKASEGKHEFDIELNPLNLGKINVKMVFENGSAEIIMTTSSEKAHQFLSSQTDALKAILEGTLGMNNNIEVKQAENAAEQFDRDNFQEQSENRQEQEHKKNKKSTEDISFADKLRLGLTDDRFDELEVI